MVQPEYHRNVSQKQGNCLRLLKVQLKISKPRLNQNRHNDLMILVPGRTHTLMHKIRDTIYPYFKSGTVPC